MRAQIINQIIKMKKYESYLEIGVGRTQSNYKAIQCKRKVGVDPFEDNKWYKFDITKLPPGVVRATSDVFFTANKDKFDVVFVDGLHHAHQVTKDVHNALDALNEGGIVILDDVNPQSAPMASVPRKQKIWTGDVWKAWVKLRKIGGHRMAVIDVTVHGGPYGLGLIMKGEGDSLVSKDRLIYANLVKNRKKWLNLVTMEESVSWI